MRWMSLEPIVRSEVSQRKTNIVYEHIYMESRKMVLMNLFAGQQWRWRYKEQTCGHSGGKERVGRIERVEYTHTHSYM